MQVLLLDAKFTSKIYFSLPRRSILSTTYKYIAFMIIDSFLASSYAENFDQFNSSFVSKEGTLR